MTSAVLPVLTGIIGLIFGSLIGYYKSRSEFQEQLARKVDRTSCADCDLREIVRNQGISLKDGRTDFLEIRDRLATIDTNIALLTMKSGEQ